VKEFRVMFRWIAPLAIAVFYSFNTSAQNSNAFPEDRDGFLKAVTGMLTDTKRDDCKETAQQLEQTWSSIQSSMQGDIMDIAAAMRSRRMLVTPYFQKFFNTVLVFQSNTKDNDVWDQWKTMTDTVIMNLRQGNNKKYEDFLDFSYALFSKHALYITPGRAWKFDADIYDLMLEKGVPVLKFSDGSLIGVTEGDSIRIDPTSGTYYPLEQKFIGKSGRADWARVGFGTDDVYVTFGKYTIDCSQSQYSVDSAKLYYGEYKKSNIYGKFADKLLAHTNAEFSTYPRFDSYKKDLSFDNLAEHVKVSGGMELVGAKMNVYGTSDQKAVIKIYRFDKLLGVVARSKHFDILKDKEINAAQAEVKIVMGKDSMIHGGVALRYNIEKRELFLFRGKNGIEKSPYYDYYHGFEETPELIYWDMNEPEVIMRNIAVGGKSTVNFESFNFYRAGKMDKYQGIADYNMVEKIRTIVDKTGSNEFYTEDLAKKIDPKYSVETIKPMLYKLVEDGFINYDDEKEIVTVREKTFRYTAAKEKKIDYDNLRLESITDSMNAIMDMRNYHIDLGGVKSLAISDSNYVVVFPRGNQLTLKEDRDMDFSGQMFAARLDLAGDGFTFDYENYKINLAKVDSVVINIPTGQRDSRGKLTVGPIKSVISDVTGHLQIDTKDNRSGLKRHPQFPILTTTQPSFVYYDNARIQGGAYTRDKFYFQINPFVFDSLNSYNWTKIRFPGKLVSAEIFPDITDQVGIQNDLSLGFNTTKQDIPMYGGKGKFTNEISLDNSGLKGKGTIKFVTSTTTSKDIVFYPDSTLARADSFVMNATVLNGNEFPTVRGYKAKVRWLPYEDSMLVKHDSIPFTLFDGKTTMKGTLVLQSTGLRGSGFVDWADAQLSSGDIAFGKNKLKADSCDFLIKSLDPKKFALSTRDVNASINFDTRVGMFKSNTDDVATVFPYNQYATSINEFKWEMDNKRMTFKAPPEELATFTSMAKDQDSLSFLGGSATYDMMSYILKINKVPNIDIADSRIIPDSGKVVIEAEAKMRTLNKAKLVMDSINELHRFDSVTANIYGKNSLKASGIYSFVNKSGKAQEIFCDDIGVYQDTSDKKLHLYAKGEIDDSARKFYLLPKIAFKGKANITSIREPVNFKGFAKLDITNPKVKAEWFSINDYVSKDSSYIHYTDPQSETRKDMTAGLVFDADSSDLYASFFNAKKSSRDKSLFVANGIVYYDDTSKAFIAGDQNKIINEAERGNVLKYFDTKGKVYAEGKMDMGLNYGMVDAQMAGNVSYDVNKEDPVFHVALGIRFFLDEDLLAYMAQSVLKGNGGGDAADYSTDEFQKAIVEFLKPKDEKAWRESMNKTGNFVQSDALPYTIFFSDVEMKWDKVTRVFYNTKPFAIAYIGKQGIGTVVPGYLEMGFKRSGDFFNLYIPAGEEDDDYWFFMSYSANIMQIAAGEKEFNAKLLEVKPEKRRVEEDGKTYAYQPGSENKKNTFINRIKFLQEQAKPPAPKKK
jgi:hypothetical protein